MVEVYRGIVHAIGGLGVAGRIALVVGITVVTTAGGAAVVVLLPADHFTRNPDQARAAKQHAVAYWAWFVVKNILGFAVFILGVVMALPLVPGPGLVFMLIGLSLLDFPGKRGLEQKLLSRKPVLHFMNNLRARFGKPPLMVN